ncbi:hypothetical protein [Nonomuraea sp. NPDC049784]|uniref:hypothetical protein n=1 Tax=Nonomuraea sp. NPDC049784 TaxID=3154361 RepID=UPI0033E23DE6
MNTFVSAGWARLRAPLLGRADLAAIGHRPHRDLPAGLMVWLRQPPNHPRPG